MADTSVTLENAYKGRLPQEDPNGYTHYYIIDWDDINVGSGSTDTVTVTLDNTPADWAVTKAAAQIVDAFAGTAGTFTLQVGVDGDPDAFVTAADAKTAGPIVNAGGVPGSGANSAGTASDVMVARFTNASSGAPADVTAGKALILIRVEDFGAYDSELPNLFTSAS